MTTGAPPLVLPRPLPAEATLGLWTPSSPAPALFPARFERALKALRRSGYGCVLSGTCRRSDGTAAAAPRALADDLHLLLDDPRVDAVVCTSGGFTMLPVLEYVDWALLRTAAKPVVGYSDITSLLWGALARARLVTFHGPMVVSEWGEHGGPWPYTLHHFRQALGKRARSADVALRPPPAWTDELLWWDKEDDRPRRSRPARWRTLVPGRAEGWLLPGCAPTAARLFGTPYMPASDGAILCLETLEMGPDQLKGLLAQWAAAGVLDRIAGLVIGRHYRPVPAAAGSTDFDAVILEALDGRAIPVLADVDFGHTEPRLTLPVGGRAVIDADAQLITLHADPHHDSVPSRRTS
ncbi:S66 peptidase family protein [Actinomadura latina]|uniref:LD-carboxypeptidase n=1 Tax=Actinomadura latina TaxID=163603 RepID=A0A846YXI8_9ACTN|nr:LD-carboxypeptidase [Actinomadura latina]NKZ03432.1 LD-carboxypeptidase [Actinomadura latina]